MKPLVHPLAALLLTGASLAAHAQAPQLPPPDAVALERLNYMREFPPAGEQLVNAANRLAYPQLRWSVQHMRELVPTRNVRRGAGPVAVLPLAQKELDGFEFEDDKGNRTTVADWLKNSYTDAIVVLHRGRIVYERYFNEMRPQTPHLLFSVTKSFTGLLAAQLVHEGKLDRNAPVAQYVPELKDTAFGDMKLGQVMDMTGSVQYREVYTDPTAEVFPYIFSSGLAPAPAGYAGPRTIYDFLKTLTKKGPEGEHGTGFVYRTVHSEVLGWVISRATGRHVAELMAERFWSRLGMEEDAYLLVDPVGTPQQGAGLNATARDLARFGEMLRRDGEFNGQRIVAAAVVEDIRRGGDREKFKLAGMAFRPGYSYHNQWWVQHNVDGAFEAAGVHGQLIHINPAAEMVVVKLGSHPLAGAAATHGMTLKALAALARAVR